PFKGYPTQRALLTTPLQTDFLGDLFASGILLADFANGIGMQAKLMPRASRQVNQVKSRQKTLLTSPGQQTHLVAVVPDAMNSPRHPRQMLPRRGVFDPIAVGQHRLTWHGIALALRGTAVSSQYETCLRYQHNTIVSRDNQNGCVCAVRETSA